MSDLQLVIDIETTGLTPNRDVILEVGMGVYDRSLEHVATAQAVVFHHEHDLPEMEPIVKKMHTDNGLLDECIAPEGTAKNWFEVQAFLIDFYRKHFGDQSVPVIGSSLRLDRNFLEYWMPTLHGRFHYRSIDVSTFKETAKRYAPVVASRWARIAEDIEETHRVVPDIQATVAEYKFYLRAFGWLPPDQGNAL